LQNAAAGQVADAIDRAQSPENKRLRLELRQFAGRIDGVIAACNPANPGRMLAAGKPHESEHSSRLKVCYKIVVL
jgi:hypothetical protein